VNALSEVLVFGRVADEARIVLDRLVEYRWQVCNQAFPKERDRQRVGSLKGSMVDYTRSAMAAHLWRPKTRGVDSWPEHSLATLPLAKASELR
jgi:hypothetical protein